MKNIISFKKHDCHSTMMYIQNYAEKQIVFIVPFVWCSRPMLCNLPNNTKRLHHGPPVSTIRKTELVPYHSRDSGFSDYKVNLSTDNRCKSLKFNRGKQINFGGGTEELLNHGQNIDKKRQTPRGTSCWKPREMPSSWLTAFSPTS